MILWFCLPGEIFGLAELPRESAFGTIFSFPPLKLLPEKGRKYFKRYWIATGLMLLGAAYLASTSTFHFN